MPIDRRYDRDFFKEWSSDMAYILGFIFADGNIIKTKRNTHYVAIYTADKELIISIANSMKSNHKISERKTETGIVYVIQIGSKELFDDLVKLGLTPNKSHRMKLPKIPNKYVNDFIRGYFDGDGCIWRGNIHKKRKKQTDSILASFTSASYGFLFDLFNTLKSLNLKGGSLFKSKKGNYSRLQYSTLDAMKLFNIMYNSDCKLFLPRKKVIFKKFIKMRS